MIVTKLCRQDFAFLNNLEIHLQELYRNQFERGPHTARRHNLLSIEGKIYILASPCLRWPPTLSNLVACSSKMVVVLFVKWKSFCSKHGSHQLDSSTMKHGKTSLTQFIQISPTKCDCDTPGCFFSFIKDLFGDPVSQQTLKRPDVENEARPRKDFEKTLNNHDVLLLLAVGKTLVPNFYLRCILWN